jgi:hypothetical protein
LSRGNLAEGIFQSITGHGSELVAIPDWDKKIAAITGNAISLNIKES